MRLSRPGINFLKRWEGLRLEAYQPVRGDRMTIGYGHTKGVSEGLTCIPAQAEKWLYEDTQWAVDAVNDCVSIPLEQHEFDAMVSFTFNVGAVAFKNSTLLRRLNNQDTDKVGHELKRWVHSGTAIIEGLRNRREAEAKLFYEAKYNV